MKTGSRKKILIADFFGTVKERGIPAYVRDLEAVAGSMAETIMLRAPAWVARQPVIVQNLLMAAHEQVAVPMHALFRRPDLIVFPYNSSSFLLSLSRRTVCVIHDLIPYQRKTRASGLTFLYVACTTRWHAKLRRRFIAVSPFTARTLKALPRFRQSSVTYIPNCFSTIPEDYTPVLSTPQRRITLISGIGPNKAFGQALDLMAAAAAEPRLADLAFDVVGFGPDHARAEAMIEAATARRLTLPSITVHPLLTRSALDALLSSNAVTWAHSQAEGFGRVVVEGRMAGRPVVMSQLSVFRALRDPFTFSYRNSNPNDFRQALAKALAHSDETAPYPLVSQLRIEAANGIKALLSR